MKKILAPTDFSENASNAIEYALQLLKGEEIILYLLHVYELPLSGEEATATSVRTMISEIEAKAQQKIDTLAASINLLYPDIKCYTLLNFINLVDACAEAVDKFTINLIVMGTQGASGIKKLLGTNTASVITHTTVPLLAVPAQARYHPLKKILFATNFNERDPVAVTSLSEIASKYNAELLLLHVMQDHEQESRMMKRFKDLISASTTYDKITYELIKKENEILETLDHFIDKEGIDLAVMPTKERGFFEQFINPRLTVKMAFHTHIPLLVLHITENKEEVLL